MVHRVPPLLCFACFPRAIRTDLKRSDPAPPRPAPPRALCSTRPTPTRPATGPRGEAMEAAGNGRREAALGALAVLPDEVLCAVVDLLPPADIGRLACVSRYPPAALPLRFVFAFIVSSRPPW